MPRYSYVSSLSQLAYFSWTPIRRHARPSSGEHRTASNPQHWKPRCCVLVGPDTLPLSLTLFLSPHKSRTLPLSLITKYFILPNLPNPPICTGRLHHLPVWLLFSFSTSEIAAKGGRDSWSENSWSGTKREGKKKTKRRSNKLSRTLETCRGWVEPASIFFFLGWNRCVTLYACTLICFKPSCLNTVLSEPSEPGFRKTLLIQKSCQRLRLYFATSRAHNSRATTAPCCYSKANKTIVDISNVNFPCLSTI